MTARFLLAALATISLVGLTLAQEEHLTPPTARASPAGELEGKTTGSPSPSPETSKSESAPTSTVTPSTGAPALSDLLFKSVKARAIGPAVMGGRISDIAIDPRNPSTFYVGMAHG